MEIRTFIVGAVALAAMASISHASLILDYNFNETGTSATSTGSDNASVLLQNSSGTATDLHTADAGGVSGLPGDRALNFSSGGIAINSIDTTLSGLETKSWTVSGWYNTPTGLSGGGKGIFNGTIGSNFSNGFYVRISNNANNLRVNKTGDETAGLWTDTNKWVFFAVSFNGATDVATFYRGYRNATEAGSNPAAVTLIDQITLTGSQGAPTPGFSIGNYAGNPSVQFFPGLLDNIRVDGSYTDSSGADTAAQLEAYREEDITNTPEPASAALLATVFVPLLLRRARRGR